VTLDFALARLTGVMDKLLVYPSGMQKNLDGWGPRSTRSACSCPDPGRRSREDSYRLVQRNAMRVLGIGRERCRCSSC
jgi:adenylosuccinate lyase